MHVRKTGLICPEVLALKVELNVFLQMWSYELSICSFHCLLFPSSSNIVSTIQLRSEWELLYISWDLLINRNAFFRKRKQTSALIYQIVPGSKERNSLLFVEFHIHVSDMVPWLQVPIQNQKPAVIYKTVLWNTRCNNKMMLA